MVYRRLGEMLIANEYITEEQLRKALEIQRKVPGKKIGEILVEQGFTTQKRVYRMLERQLGVEFIDLAGAVIPKEMARLVPRSIARKYNVIPIQATADTLHLAMSDTLNFMATEAVRMVSKRKIVPMLATSEAISRAIADLYGSESAEKALQDLKTTEDQSTTDFQNIAAANVIGADNENAAPTIRLVNSFLEYAVNQNCSDIHLEP